MAVSGYSFDRYLNVRSASVPSFSPDGKRLAFLTDITGVVEVWSVPVGLGSDTPSWPEQVTFRGERCASATYSPAANVLLVTGDIGGTENNQLYCVSDDGALFSELTRRPDLIFQFGGWSPDGLRICYSSNERDRRYFDVYERRVEGGEPRLLLQHDGTNHAVKYAPDGLHVLVSRADSNVRNQLLLVDVTTGEIGELTPRQTDGPGAHEQPAWSADGSGLYLLSDRGGEYLTLAWLDLQTHELTYLREAAWDTEAMALSADGSRMALVTNVDGFSRLELFDVSQGWYARTVLPSPTAHQGVIKDLAWSRDGSRLAFALDTAESSADVWVWDVAQAALWRATRSAQGGIPSERFVAPSLVRFPTFDEREIPGFLFLPQGKEPHNLPFILYVHGGPESQFRPVFNPILQYFVNRGYGVLAPNVRGSSGYGYDYQSLDDVRLRMNSVADLRSAALWLGESGIADATRIAIMGRSYGGFMVLSALTTYPDLWAAGVDIVGIANFVTFLEHTGPWRRKLRETEYGSLENDREYLEEISPINSVEKIAAPLFVLHGANDPRVPVGETVQIADAVRARGIPVESLIFDDEGHQFGKRKNNLVAYPAIARFLDEHMGKQ